MQHRLAMLVCLSLLTSLAFGSEDAPSWILRKDDNGIRVYTREQPGSSFRGGAHGDGVRRGSVSPRS
jgi:hypothetical protein